jgi:predicted secreted protein
MNEKPNIVMVLLAIFVLVVGCIDQEKTTLTMNDNGAQIHVHKGQIITLTLESQLSAGYSWDVAEIIDPNTLRQIGEAEFQQVTDKLGGGELQTFKFEVINTGGTGLKLIYHKPWETDVEPLNTFAIIIIVK